MNIIEIRKHLPDTVFTHDLLEGILRDKVSNINVKIANMVKKGELVRLKRGVYILGAEYRRSPLDMIGIANVLYAPSYVSFEYALSYYGLIPERVYEITSATSRLKKSFDTPLGRFTYRPLPPQAYAIGIDWLFDERHGGRLIATPEKALCDKIRADRGIGKLSQQKLAEYLDLDLRIDMDRLYDLDSRLILRIAEVYRSSSLKNLSKLIGKRKQSA